jgi:N-formylglutamate amidohydrolase
MVAPRIVVHVPHASVVIPDDLRAAFLLGDGDLERELVAMTDRYTDELFLLPNDVTAPVVFPVSRLVVDPERFAEDSSEPMSKKGMGVVYTTTSDGRPLRQRPLANERSQLLARFYEPHHTSLEGAVAAALQAHGSCVVIDGHSFPSRALPYEDDQRNDRPDICIGTDAYHTPKALRDAAVAVFERAGFRVDVDRPFAGALVPMAFYRRDARVYAVMIEINRGLYMDEDTGGRLVSFTAMQRRIHDTIEALIGASRPF